MLHISVFDMNGRRVQILLNESVDAGHHVTNWNGTDAAGELVGSGVYFIRMRSDEFEQVRKVVLMK
ncbi:MAG: T9SS type A sorting domain-containing protein [candidate division KSB1 bacterium]|nr:T9SS type A sorting domain-containing protein [candidate division KSB1 bacterium]